MIYNLIRSNGSIEYSTQDKKELEWYMSNNWCKNARFYDINGYSIPFKVKTTIGAKNGIKIGTTLSKLTAAISVCGRQYQVGKGASALKILKYDDRMFDEIIMTDKGKKHATYSFSLAR